MPLSLYTEPKLLDQLLGSAIGKLNQAVTAPAAATTSLTVMGTSGAGGLDVAVPANGYFLIGTPGSGATQNQYPGQTVGNLDIFLSTAGAAAAATSIAIPSQTVGKTRAVGDWIWNLGTTTTFAPFMFLNTVYVGLTTAGAQTTVAAASDGLAATGTITLASTTGFPNSTQIVLIDTTTGLQTVQYTATSGSTLTGCTTGGVGLMKTGDVVMLLPSSASLLGAEPSATGGYARVSVINNAANFSAATLPAGTSPPALKVNAAAITFPASTAAWSSGATVLDAFFIADASTLGAGNVLAWGYLSVAQAVNASGITPSFAGGALSATLL
jgi:hypothetical protein